MDLEAGVLMGHVSEDNCLECPNIDTTRAFGNLYWCKVNKHYIRTNPLCGRGWLIISDKKGHDEAVSPPQRAKIDTSTLKTEWVARAIVPQVCDRLKCRVASCYGWDLCRQARDEATKEEWNKLLKELYEEEEVDAKK